MRESKKILSLYKHNKLDENSKEKVIDYVYPPEVGDPDRDVDYNYDRCITKMVQNPTTSQHLINKITNGMIKYHEYTSGLATHPNNTHENKLKLTKYVNSASELAQKEKHPEILNKIIDSFDPRETVFRFSIFSNPHLTSNHINKIHDKTLKLSEGQKITSSPSYASNVVRHRNTPSNVLHDLRDEHEMIQDDILHHPNASVDTKNHILNSQKYKDYESFLGKT